MRYNIVSDSDGANIVVYAGGEILTADDKHPNFKAIVAAAVEGDENVGELFDVGRAVATRFERLSDRVTVAHGHVYFDGDEVHGTLVDHILQAMNEGAEDFTPLVNFYEKIAQNPNSHSRENLYDWLKATGGFTITPEGDLVGYKGVRPVEGGFTSISTGPAIVDGQSVNGAVPNNPGSVVEMSRSKVQHDPTVGCSTGLHVGTWDYANSFGNGTVLEVHVNPRDVVSVPTDCNGEKMRVSRYKVVQQVQGSYSAAVVPYEDYEDYEDDEIGDYCDHCGEFALEGDYCTSCEEYVYV